MRGQLASSCSRRRSPRRVFAGHRAHAAARRSPRWTTRERFGALVLAHRRRDRRSTCSSRTTHTTWFIGTHFWHRAFTYGLWAFGALTIGVGILPVLSRARLGARRADRDARGPCAARRARRRGRSASALYTAVKASYLVDDVRDPRRGAQPDLPEPDRLRRRRTRGCCARRVACRCRCARRGATGYLLWSTPYHAYEHLYSDAFGLSILQWLNQTWSGRTRTSVAAVRDPRRRGAARACAAARASARHAQSRSRWSCSGCAIVAWNLTGEISAANQAVAPAKFQRSLLPTPPDWIDRADGPRAHDVLRQGPVELVRVLVARVLEPVDPGRLVGRRHGAAAGPDDDPELPRHRRRARPAATARLGRGASPGSSWSGARPSRRAA